MSIARQAFDALLHDPARAEFVVVSIATGAPPAADARGRMRPIRGV